MNLRQSVFRLGCALAAPLLLLNPASAQDVYPSRPVRVIVPTGAGGANDFVFQVLSEKFRISTGHPLVIENRAGASGTIAAEAVARAAPDGYTVLAAIPTVLSINPFVFKRSPYDAEKSFIPVTQLLNTNYYLLGNAGVPASNLKDLIAWAKSNPGKLSFGSAGMGSTSHFLAAMLGQSAGIEMLHVPYKGASLAVNDLISGQINISVSALMSVKAHLTSGKFKAFAVASERRSASMPEVPTFTELGYPDVVATLWMGLVAPANTPAPIVEKLASEMIRALNLPDVKEKFLAADQEVVGSTPSKFAEFLAADRRRWGIAVKASGFKAAD